jgi:hypothetical protein
VASNGTAFISSLVKIDQLVQKYKPTDTETQDWDRISLLKFLKNGNQNMSTDTAVKYKNLTTADSRRTVPENTE